MQHISANDVFLQVADVLIDEEGVFEASGILADYYLAPQNGLSAETFQQTGSTSQRDREDKETCVYNAVAVWFRTLCTHQVYCIVRQSELYCTM